MSNKECTIIALFFIALAFSLSGSYNASAAPQATPFDFFPGQGSLEWDDIDNRFGDPNTNSPFSGFCDPEESEELPGAGGLAIDDAISIDGSSDAYDTAWLTTVGDTFVGTGGIGDLTGSTYNGLPVNISGLDVTYQLFFSENTQCNRFVLFMDNNTAGDINESVSIATNFGSDSSTVFDATSSGGMVFSTADRWTVTSDEFPASDPVNTTVFYGPGFPESTPNLALDMVCTSSSEDGVGVRYDVSVPAGQGRCLMLFACLGDITGNGNTIAGAVANAPLFNSVRTIPGDLLSGLSDQQLSECVNWDFQSVGVPTLSEWGLIAMAGVLGIIGFIVIRKRKLTA